MSFQTLNSWSIRPRTIPPKPVGKEELRTRRPLVNAGEVVSPNLLNAKDLKLAVPGTYNSNSDSLVTIRSFAPNIEVLI